MKTLFDFVKMSRSERFEYVQHHGLTEEERKDLLEMNKIITALFREDAYIRGGGKPFKGTIEVAVEVPNVVRGPKKVQ